MIQGSTGSLEQDTVQGTVTGNQVLEKKMQLSMADSPGFRVLIRKQECPGPWGRLSADQGRLAVRGGGR